MNEMYRGKIVKKRENTKKSTKNIMSLYSTYILLAWTAIILLSIIWNYNNEQNRVEEIAKNEARSNFNKDMAFRQWATDHGGVYVPVSKKTPPNPYLKHIPERDIVTPSGKRLTLMNPAYMLRQLMEDYETEYGIHGHITSLKLIRKENAPDEWEAKALKSFKEGNDEIYEFTQMKGEPHLRLMRPLIIKKGCLKCHAKQGYKVGDIRGGIGVAIPLDQFIKPLKEHLLIAYISHFTLWILGIVGVRFGLHRIRTHLSEQEKAEKKIRKLQHFFDSIIDSMPSIMLAVDKSGIIKYSNREAIQFSGIGMDNALGKSIEQLLRPFSLNVNQIKNAISAGHIERLGTFQVREDKKTRYFDIMVYPLDPSNIEEAVIRIDDVTERIQIQEIMEQTEKMMSVGGLAAGMAHEINNPLSGILQGQQNIIRRFSADYKKNRDAAQEIGVDLKKVQLYMERRQILEFLNGIKNSGERAATVVKNMLQFSRRQGQLMTKVNLNELLDGSVELASIDYDLKKKYDFRNIEIIREYEKSLPKITCVPGEIEQVVLNLLKNAAQAMSDAYTEDEMKRKGQIIIRTKKSGKYARVEIQDNGPGINDDVKPRVFEPFFTTKEPGVGTGLGLSVSYYIVVDSHKGAIQASSPKNGGTNFIIDLPLETDVEAYEIV